MNFIGHAIVASRRSRSAPYLLGAMLPDFCSIARARLREVTHEEIASGVAFHHATDAVFHEAPTFIRLCTVGVRELAELGVERGPARAVAHIATELLLDGHLLGAHAPPHREYHEALTLARQDRLGEHLIFRRAEHGERFHRVRARLEAWGIPDRYADPIFVAERVAAALRGRPRLALSDAAAACVGEWMPAAQRRLVAHADELLSEVDEALPSG